MLVRTVTADDQPWIRAFLDERWGGQEQVANGETFRPADLPGYLAEIDGEIVGYAAVREGADGAEIAVIEALRPQEGIGSALVAASIEYARSIGSPVLRAITTNDNWVAQAFYVALGFRPVETRPGAVTESRKIKPQIPLEGADGTPITDELEYELTLEPASG